VLKTPGLKPVHWGLDISAFTRWRCQCAPEGRLQSRPGLRLLHSTVSALKNDIFGINRPAVFGRPSGTLQFGHLENMGALGDHQIRRFALKKGRESTFG
jgi:hypothetical protein